VGSLIIYYIVVFLVNGEKVIENNDGQYFLYKVEDEFKDKNDYFPDFKPYKPPPPPDDRYERFPYPYIYKPPRPPDDIEPALQAQIKIPKEKKEPQIELDCPYCGYKISKEQKYCPICGKDVF